MRAIRIIQLVLAPSAGSRFDVTQCHFATEVTEHKQRLSGTNDSPHFICAINTNVSLFFFF